MTCPVCTGKTQRGQRVRSHINKSARTWRERYSLVSTRPAAHDRSDRTERPTTQHNWAPVKIRARKKKQDVRIPIGRDAEHADTIIIFSSACPENKPLVERRAIHIQITSPGKNRTKRWKRINAVGMRLSGRTNDTHSTRHVN